MEIPESIIPFNFTNCSTSLAEVGQTNITLRPIFASEVAQADLSVPVWHQIYTVCVSVVATPANLIVIICLWGDPGSEVSGFSTYAVSVAFTDLLVGVVLMPLRFIEGMLTTWPFGLTGCILWRQTDFGLTSVSVFLFLAMGYDRYRCVTAPLQYRSHFKTTKAAWISVFVWIVGFILWTLYLLLKIFMHQVNCILFTFGPNFLEVIQFTVAYYIPILALIIMNSILIWTLNTRIPRSQSSAVNSRRTPADISTVTDVIGHHSRPCEPVMNVSVMVSKKKHSKMTSIYKIVILVVVFSVCWLPYCITWPLDGLCRMCISGEVRQICTLLTYGQSAINPLIVICTSHQIRSKIARTCVK